jgi:hypothetical protein
VVEDGEQLNKVGLKRPAWVAPPVPQNSPQPPYRPGTVSWSATLGSAQHDRAVMV